MSRSLGDDRLTVEQEDALIALYGACATPDHYYWMPLYKLRDERPYLDGRTSQPRCRSTTTRAGTVLGVEIIARTEATS